MKDVLVLAFRPVSDGIEILNINTLRFISAVRIFKITVRVLINDICYLGFCFRRINKIHSARQLKSQVANVVKNKYSNRDFEYSDSTDESQSIDIQHLNSIRNGSDAARPDGLTDNRPCNEHTK